jgi:hypothetical protein
MDAAEELDLNHTLIKVYLLREKAQRRFYSRDPVKEFAHQNLQIVKQL